VEASDPLYGAIVHRLAALPLENAPVTAARRLAALEPISAPAAGPGRDASLASRT